MPVSALHIGIPGLISYFFPKRIDVASAILGSMIVDVDFFLHLLMDTPLHGFLHSLVGATLIAFIPIFFVSRNQKLFDKIKIRCNWERKTTMQSISYGAFLGVYSHLLLDSLIYNDMNLLYPIEGNPLYFNYGNIVFYSVYIAAIITTIAFLILLYLLAGNLKNKKE